MRIKLLPSIVLFFLLTSATSFAQSFYTDGIVEELNKAWPNNRTINIVFHGHSVPTGYFRTPFVNKFESYPMLALKDLKAKHPNAVVNSITTSIGGEHSESGERRLLNDVLNHKPDVLFIDYALNDRGIGLVRAKAAWEKMIKTAQAYRFKSSDGTTRSVSIVLMTPTPDTNENILDDNAPLAKHAEQIKQLARQYGLRVVDSYGWFKVLAQRNNGLDMFMAQPNHINAKGHQHVATGVVSILSPRQNNQGRSQAESSKDRLNLKDDLGIDVVQEADGHSLKIIKPTKEPITLKVVDMSGREVSSYVVSDTESNVVLENNLHRGVYILNFIKGQRRYSKRIRLNGNE